MVNSVLYTKHVYIQLNSKYEKSAIFDMKEMVRGGHKCGCYLLNIGLFAPQKCYTWDIEEQSCEVRFWISKF